MRACGEGLLGMSALVLNVLDNEQMLQKLGKKHRLLPAVPLWPGELAHWRTHWVVLSGAPGAAAGEH